MAAQRDIPVGSTGIMVTVPLRSSTTGQLLTGVAYGSVIYSYIKDGAATGATGTCVASTKGTWADHGWVETDYAGLYQFGVLNACLSTAVRGVKIKISATGAIDAVIDIQIVSPTRGLAGTALPDAVAGAVSGVPVLATVDSILTIPAALKVINASSILGTGTQIATAFVTMLNVATPRFTVASYNQSGDCFLWEFDALESMVEEIYSAFGTILGTGDTAVDHNTGGTDALRYVDPDGVGVDGVTISAYLKSDYDAGTYTRRARTTTKTDGRWVSPLMLNSGLTYVIEFLKDGVYGPDTSNVTLS